MSRDREPSGFSDPAPRRARFTDDDFEVPPRLSTPDEYDSLPRLDLSDVLGDTSPDPEGAVASEVAPESESARKADQ